MKMVFLLPCFSGDFYQTGPCGARTGLCPGGGGSFPYLGWKPATRGLLGAKQGALSGFVGRLAVSGFPSAGRNAKFR